MEHRDLIAKVHSKPGLFGLDGSYQSSTSFLIGLDLGSYGGLLRGFNEWLAVKIGYATSLGWQSLVLEIAFKGESVGRPVELSADQERRAVDLLFSLLRDFLELRESPLQLAQMYVEYRSLYDPENRE